MPAASLAADDAGGHGSPDATLTSSRAPSGAATATASGTQFSTEEIATLAELRDKVHNAEVICIVRPLGNPQAKSEIIVLDKASQAFLDQLAAAQNAQSAALHVVGSAGGCAKRHRPPAALRNALTRQRRPGRMARARWLHGGYPLPRPATGESAAARVM